MIKVLNFIFRLIVNMAFGGMVIFFLFMLSVLLWDKEYLVLADKINDKLSDNLWK